MATDNSIGARSSPALDSSIDLASWGLPALFAAAEALKSVSGVEQLRAAVTRLRNACIDTEVDMTARSKAALPSEARASSAALDDIHTDLLAGISTVEVARDAIGANDENAQGYAALGVAIEHLHRVCDSLDVECVRKAA